MNSRFMLVLLLRAFGGVTCTALFAVFLPTRWMADTHAWLGLGDFPTAPITLYLARSLSALYAMLGGLVVLVSFDVVRYATIIRYMAYTTIGFGVLALGIDLSAGLPSYWTAYEGPGAVVVGVATLLLIRGVVRSGGSPAADCDARSG